MTDAARLYRQLQIDLSNAHFYGVSWREMGRAAGLSPTTVKKLATGDTVRPSFNTVAALALYAGHVVTIARSSHVARLGKVTRLGKPLAVKDAAND